MPFKRQVLHANISLIIASGFLLSLCASESVAQSPQVACRANDAGDGWVCSTIDSDGTTVAISRSNRPRSNSNTISTASATISSTRSSQSLDWLSKSQMSDQQLQALDNNCCGAFIEPLRENIDINADPSEAETRFDAIQGFSQQQTGQYQIDGDILVQQGNRTIENDNTTLINTNNGDNSVSMQGNVVFREPNVLLLGDGAFIDNSRGINRIDAAQYVLHDLGVHGSAEQLVYDSNSGLLTLINGEFSRCEPQQPLWRLRADTITIDQEQGRGYAKNVSLLIGNIPVFYYPFTLPFPLGEERISGLLAPSTGSTSSGGFDFSLPYYFNLAPNYDATVTPRLISDRGVMLSTELRYLSKRSMNTLNLSHLAKDKLFDATTADIAGSDSPPVENRWFIGYEQMAQLNQSWSTLIDYSAVSDVDYFRDLGSTGLNVVSRTHLNREARLNYNQGSTRAGIKLQSIQIIDPFVSEADINRPYDKLPQLFFNTQWRLPAGFKLGLSSQLTAFDRSLDQALLSSSDIDNGALVNGSRVNLEPSLNWAYERPGWFLRSSAKYKYAAYSLKQQAQSTADNPSTGAAVFSLDGGLVFERDLNIGPGGYTQTLEPRAFYLYSPYQDQSAVPIFDSNLLNFSFNQLFRDERFSGGDRIGDTNQLSVAITSRILDDSGRERARVSVGQINYFEDRLVSLDSPLRNWQQIHSPLANTSAIAAEFSYAFSPRWQIASELQWNQDTRVIDEGSFQFRYQGDSRRLLNIAYRLRTLVSSPGYILPTGADSRIKQTDISTAWPLNDNWRLLGRWNYDHTYSRNLESFAGVEYSNCCATVRIIAREWVHENELFLSNVKTNTGVFLQITLNGLGNVTGGGIGQLLSDGIFGFRDSNYEN